MIRKYLMMIVILAVLLAACGPAATASPTESSPDSSPTATTPPEPTPTAEPDVVVLGLSNGLSSLPIIIALEEGYFAEQNLLVEANVIESTADMYPLLASGDLDVATGSLQSGLFNLLAQERNVKVVADKGYSDPEGCPANALVVRRDVLNSGALEDAESVRGLNFAVSVTAPTGYILNRWVQETFSISIDDLNTNRLPGNAIVDALNNGAVDAATGVEPNLSLILQSTDTEIFLTYNGYLDDISFGQVIFGPGLLVENRDAGQRFMVAYLKAVRQYLEGATDRNLEIATAALELEPDFLRGVCWPAMRPDGQINYAATLDWQNWEVAQGRIDRVVTEEEFWDSSFVEYANEVLGAP